MPRYKVVRETYYRQLQEVTVEARTSGDAYMKAVELEDPKFDWEQVERTKGFDKCRNPKKVEEDDG